jgi:hypothetical protein
VPHSYNLVPKRNLYTVLLVLRCLTLAPFAVSRFRVGHASSSMRAPVLRGGGLSSTMDGRDTPVRSEWFWNNANPYRTAEGYCKGFALIRLPLTPIFRGS